MQRIATQIFIFASVCFGAVGVAVVITAPRDTEPISDLNQLLFVLLGIAGFVVLSSFALSVAGKYLRSDD